MKHSLLVIFVTTSLLGLGGLTGCANFDAPEHQPMTLEQVIALAKEGKDAQTIIQEIQSSRTLFDVTASQYAKLSRDGVPDAVIDFMQNGQMKMAARQGRREAMNDAWFWSRGYWGWGDSGNWAPRPYGIWLNGRYFKRSY